MDNPDILRFLLSESADANYIVDTDKIIQSLQEIQTKTDYLTYLAVNDSKDPEYFEEFRMALQHDFLTFNIFIKQLEALNNDKKAYFELGKLYGTLQLCSRICYDKIKSTHQSYENYIEATDDFIEKFLNNCNRVKSEVKGNGTDN